MTGHQVGNADTRANLLGANGFPDGVRPGPEQEKSLDQAASDLAQVRRGTHSCRARWSSGLIGLDDPFLPQPVDLLRFKSGGYQAVLFPQQELAEVYFSLAKADSDGLLSRYYIEAKASGKSAKP